jgi:hypothetical protein
MHFLVVLLACKSVDRSTFCMKRKIVEFFVVNFICARLFAVGNYYAIDCLHLTSLWRHVQVRIWVSMGCETSLL